MLFEKLFELVNYLNTLFTSLEEEKEFLCHVKQLHKKERLVEVCALCTDHGLLKLV